MIDEETVELMMFDAIDPIYETDLFVVWNIVEGEKYIIVYIKAKGITLRFTHWEWRSIESDILFPDADDSIYVGGSCSYWATHEDGKELTGLYLWENKCLVRFTPQE